MLWLIVGLTVEGLIIKRCHLALSFLKIHANLGRKFLKKKRVLRKREDISMNNISISLNGEHTNDLDFLEFNVNSMLK